MAAAWAVMSHFGFDGYVDLTRQTLANADEVGAGIAEFDVFALGDALPAKGRFHDRQGPPDSLHSTISNSNTVAIDQYVADRAQCVAEVRGGWSLHELRNPQVVVRLRGSGAQPGAEPPSVKR